MTIGLELKQLDRLEITERLREFNKIVELVATDEDLLITGAPGSGRSNLIQRVSETIGAFVIEIDCIRATSDASFVKLLAYAAIESMKLVDSSTTENLFEQNEVDERENICGCKQIDLLTAQFESNVEATFKLIISRIENFSLEQNKRTIIVLKQLSHIRSWDRSLEWEQYVRKEIKENPTVSYIVLETVAEIENKRRNKLVKHVYEQHTTDIVEIKPLRRSAVTFWLRETFRSLSIPANLSEDELQVFVEASDGHVASIRALFLQVKMMYEHSETTLSKSLLVEAKDMLLETLSTSYESLLLTLPNSQLQLIECLAIEPTAKPHRKDYIERHNLIRGGSLRGALEGLQRKGLIYGAEDEFRLTLPLFSEWIRRRIW